MATLAPCYKPFLIPLKCCFRINKESGHLMEHRKGRQRKRKREIESEQKNVAVDFAIILNVINLR